MVITIDDGSRTPPYEQIREQVAAQVASGERIVGSRLPTIRQLADELGLAPNTVARSYRELEAAGIVETRGRAGSVVAANGDQAMKRVAASARAYAEFAREVGVSGSDALRVVTAAIADGSLA